MSGDTENTVDGDVPGRLIQSGSTGSINMNDGPVVVVNYQKSGTPASGVQAWNIPARNPNFTGRQEFLDRVRSQLDHAVVAVHGMGGVGKTQLAIEYAHRHAAEYDIAWWIPSEQPEMIPNHLARLGAELGLVDAGDLAALAGQVVAVLRNRTRWLLVFDNAEDPDALRPYLPGQSGQVLTTTRRTNFTSLGSVLDVDVLPRAESVAMLHRRIPGMTCAEQLAELLGDLPLALEQAAAYVESSGLPVNEYLALVQDRGEEMLDAGKVSGYEYTLATVWSLALDRIAEESPAALELLGLCAYLAPDAIPLDLFSNHPDKLPQTLGAVVTDRKLWADTVGALVSYALIRRKDQMISLHRLIQTALRRRAPEALSVVLNLLCIDLPGKIMRTPESWPRWQQLLPHVLIATEHAGNTPNTPWLLDRTAAYLYEHGQPSHARPLFERALAITEAHYGPNHPEVATRLNNLGAVLRDLGQPDQARELFERALAITEAHYEPNHPHIAIRLNNLGLALHVLGQPDQARPLLERALAINEAAYGSDHPLVAIELDNLGKILRSLGQPDQAKRLHERALAIDETHYGPNHPVVAIDLDNLGAVLRDLDQPDQARLLFDRALAIYEAAYGAGHPYTQTVREHLGE